MDGAAAGASFASICVGPLGAPVVAYRRGKGVMDDRHPLAQVVPGGHALWPSADVVLAVGTRLQWPSTNWGTDEKLTINFSTTTISKIRPLEPSEISAVFDTDSNSPGAGSLYRLNIPSSKKFLHKNSLCGAEDTHWMVAYSASNTLQLAFFSGEKPPVFTFDAIANSTDKCGTYTYVK